MHTFGPFCYEFENVEEEIVDVCGEHRTAVVIKSSDFGDWAHQGGFLC